MKTAYHAPAPVAGFAARVGRILAPTDFSPISRAAVNATVAMLEGNPEASLTLLHVVDTVEPEEGDDPACEALHRHTLASRVNHADRRMKELRAEYGDRSGLESRIIAGQAARTICDIARDESYDLIVMSSHGHAGLARIIIGSVAEQVVQEAPCAVLVAKPPKNQAGEFVLGPVPLKFARLLVGYDHRAGSRHALDMARELAETEDSQITLVHALQPAPLLPDCPADPQARAELLQEALDKLAAVRSRRLPAAENWTLRVEVGEPWDVIVRIAKETCSDLIVVGPHEHTRWGHCYVGSTAQRVVRRASCPVLVVK